MALKAQQLILRTLLAVVLTLSALSPSLAAQKAQQVEFLLAGMRHAGSTLSAGTVTFYAPGTISKQTIWLDRNKTQTAANPYTLDSNGRAELFADGVYDVLIKSSTGSTVASFEDMVFQDENDLPYYDIRDYGSNLATAVAAIGSNQGTLLIGSGGITVSTAVTVPSTLGVEIIGSGGFNKSGSGAITFNGPFEAETRQVFTGFAAGEIAGLKVVKPEWWGATGNDTTDDVSAIASAISAASAVDFGDGKTFYTSGNALKSNLRLYGSSTLKFYDTGGMGALYSNNENLSNVYIEPGLKIDMTGTTHTGTANQYPRGIYIKNLGNAKAVFNINIQGVKFVGLKVDAFHSYGGAREIFFDGNQCFGDVSDNQITLADCIRLEADYSTVPYGTRVHTGIRVTNNYAYGMRSLWDFKRGTADAQTANNLSVNALDAHYSADNAFNIVSTGDQTADTASFYASITGATDRKGFEIQGENITIANALVRDPGATSGRGIMVTQYGHPSDTVHQSRNVTIKGAQVSGDVYQAYRLIDCDSCKVYDSTANEAAVAQAMVIEHSAETGTAFYPTNNRVINNDFGSNTVASSDSTSLWDGNKAGGADVSTFAGTVKNSLLFRNPHLKTTASIIDGATHTEVALAGSTLPTNEYIYRSVVVQDTSAGNTRNVTISQNFRTRTLFVGIWNKLITASACSLLFQEYKADGTFLSSTFTNLNATTSWQFSMRSYTASHADWGYTVVSFVPAAGFNDPAVTGQTEIAGWVVSDTFVAQGSLQALGGVN